MPRRALRNRMLLLSPTAIASAMTLSSMVPTIANWNVNRYDSRMRLSVNRAR
jgi:hypothetical protein